MFLFYIFYKILWFIVIVVGDLRKVNFKLMLSLNNHPIRKAKKIKIPAIFNWINMHAFVCYLVPLFDYLCAQSRDISLFTCLNWHKLLYMGLYYAELAWRIKGISKTVISQPCQSTISMVQCIIALFTLSWSNVDVYIEWRKCYGLTMHQCIIAVLQSRRQFVRDKKTPLLQQGKVRLLATWCNWKLVSQIPRGKPCELYKLCWQPITH